MTQSVDRCNFCRKTSKQVPVLVAGHDSMICHECIEVARKVADDKLKEKKGKDELTTFTPQAIYDLLEEYVIGQSEAKKVLATGVYNHIKRIKSNRINRDVEISKSNILVLGPTGSGKTLLAQTLAKILSLPFAMGDATTLTEAGYVGEDVENLVSRLYQSTDGDITKTEQGIIYIDEIDKIARKSEGISISRDVSGEGVQQALLKMIEGAPVSVPINGTKKTVQSETVLIDTKNVLFICGGAFVGLEEIVSKRVRTNAGLGFGRASARKKTVEEENYEILKDVSNKDLQKFGIIPELLGRLPIVVPLKKLSEDDLVKILTEPKNSLTKQYQRLFDLNSVELIFNKDALYMIANYANKIDLGARVLRQLMEKILLEPMFHAPTMKSKTVEVTTEMVEEALRIQHKESLKVAVG